MHRESRGRRSFCQVQRAIHTKACVEAVGAKRGLEVIRAAGFVHVVVWAGHSLEHITSIGIARELGLDVLGVAMPKLVAAAPGAASRVATYCDAAAKAEAPCACFIFDDDRLGGSPAEYEETIARLNDSPVAVAIENSGRVDACFSNLLELLTLTEAIGSARIVFDLGHAAIASADCSLEAVPLAWVDVHDNDGANDLHWPLGRGIGRGSSLGVLADIAESIDTVVVETDARAGDDARAWRAALASDHRHLSAVLDQEDRAAW